MEEFKVGGELSREVARIRPDGTWWITPDITMPEVRTAIPLILEAAAKLLQQVTECKQRHQS